MTAEDKKVKDVLLAGWPGGWPAGFRCSALSVETAKFATRCVFY
jgi:hypothetical protein